MTPKGHGISCHWTRARLQKLLGFRIMEAGDTAWAPRRSVGRTAGFRDFDGETPNCTGLFADRTRVSIS